VDSIHLAGVLSRVAQAEGKQVDVLLEVNVAGEESKFGFTPSQVPTAAAIIANMSGLNAFGLMTVAPMGTDPELVRPVFRQLRELRDRLLVDVPSGNWRRLSMGMTGDFEVAIEEGATIVRVGRAIFGERP
jgi:PLP dependent protein